jgi:hypothetical protein
MFSTGMPLALPQEQLDPSAALPAFGMGFWLFVIVVAIIEIAAMWKVFEKAGRPGWAAIVPIYNLVVLCQVAGKSGWWVLLFMIPLVNIIVAIMVAFGLAKSFGKGGLFAVGLLLLGLIFYPILGFGDAEYQGAA